ncbi:Double-stranded RNA-binding domain [Cinara cedri]|uniref:Double-stranded RNA-binding domain n=1 Tax=Cinara cedri TaxID=506608 RepID=A0A5E4M5W4_9HEMI|nr:Double-stranded RNA-binding domain [Cinara cedri]
MADDNFDDWWKSLWEKNKVVDFELEKNRNETKDNSIFNERTPDDFVKAKRMKFKEFNENNSQLYDSLDNGGVKELPDKAYQRKTKINQDKTAIEDNFKELEEETKNYYDILPKDWIEINHKSGMPIYLHTKSRTVSLTRPYFLGSDDPELHVLPPIPPLLALSSTQGEKGFETEETKINDHDFQTRKLDNMIKPTAEVKNSQENINKKSSFKIKEINAALEQSSPQHTSSENVSIQTNSVERPLLSDSDNITSFPVQSEEHERLSSFQKWILHQNGKSVVYILKEYLTKIFKIKPVYDFKETENSETPYSASVFLKNVCYGVGSSQTKRQAKLNAARATLYILIPQMNKKTDLDQQIHHYPAIFNQLEITDRRVSVYCDIFSKKMPYEMLLLCLQKNFKDYEVDYRYRGPYGKLSKYSMKVGQFAVYVQCVNKEDGKQIASQTMLDLLHPPIDNWGSLLCLYDGLELIEKPPQLEHNIAVINELKKTMYRFHIQSKSSKDSNTQLLPESK